MTVDPKELEKKLKEIYPEIDKYNLEMKIEQDPETSSWVVTFSKEGQSLSTHIEYEDIENCLQGKECVHLGVQLGRFMKNYCDDSGECQI